MKILQCYMKTLQENTAATTTGSNSNPLKMADSYCAYAWSRPVNKLNRYSTVGIEDIGDYRLAYIDALTAAMSAI